MHLIVFEPNIQDGIHRNTGLSLEQFNDLFQKIPTLGTLISTRFHAPSALYMYLMKMRTGLPSADIGKLFGVTRTTVDKQLQKVRTAMKQDFVFEHVNYIRGREELLQSNTEMGRRLFCRDKPDTIVLICDGTYIYVNKSRNYDFQKRTYNDQKKRNFIKIMMCVTCNGEIVYALGPYPAVQNDATILKSIFETTDAFDQLQQDDVLILDRGFRDCVHFLRQKGIDVKMPHLIQRSETKRQLSTADANNSRLVTAIRFVVEARNGHLKTVFNIFDSTWNTLSLKHLQDDIQICSALINCYFRKIESNKGIADEIAEKMVEKLEIPNDFARIIATQSFQNNMKLMQIFIDFDSLPQLTEHHLLRISFGPYQIKQAASYCQEHMKAHQNQFEVFSLPENKLRDFFSSFYDDDREPVLLYTNFRSRFTSGKKHRTFVLIDTKETDENAVLQYCCSCYSGLRTVGCCSHVMCVIWFTLFIKNRDIPKPASFMDDYFDNTENIY